MSAIATPQGEIFVTGKVHGSALNCTVVPFADPSKWYMVQFVSQAQLDQYVLEHDLITRSNDDPHN